jgi:hypothetical protein
MKMFRMLLQTDDCYQLSYKDKRNTGRLESWPRQQERIMREQMAGLGEES